MAVGNFLILLYGCFSFSKIKCLTAKTAKNLWLGLLPPNHIITEQDLLIF